MSEITNSDFADFGAVALDRYQELFDDPKGLDHRADADHALSLLGDLLADLMHYADARGVDFDHALTRARTDHTVERVESGRFEIGSLVQLIGPEARRRENAGLTTRGQVTGVLTPQDGPVTFYVKFPGETSGHAFGQNILGPAPKFPMTVTSTGMVGTPLAAETALVNTVLRIEAGEVPGSAPRVEDLRDHRALLTALSSWVGLDERRTSELIRPKIFAKLRKLETEPAPEWLSAHLAAQDFPQTPGEELRPHESNELDHIPASQLSTRPPTTRSGPTR
jgi:hypothetical protein